MLGAAFQPRFTISGSLNRGWKAAPTNLHRMTLALKEMDIRPMNRMCQKLALTIVCAMLLFGSHAALAQEDVQDSPSQSSRQQILKSDEPATVSGYPVRARRVGTPMDVEWNLDNSFPKSGSVLEMIFSCQKTRPALGTGPAK